MKKHFTTILLILFLIAGLSLLLYPTLSNYWNSLHQSRAISHYADLVNDLDEEEYEKIWQAATDYNHRLYKSQAASKAEREKIYKDYDDMLNIAGNGIMGYIDIPSISCSLPIYHGTTDEVLQIAVGHIRESSLPVGGESSHSILSGHRGLPSAKLFTDLDKLSEGDIFTVTILKTTLTYEVDKISVVLPSQVTGLDVKQGKDYCTLVTCTPYGVNSHRLLVRGKRIETAESDEVVHITSDAMQIEPIIVAPIVAVPIIFALSIWAMSSGRKNKSRGKNK